MSQEPVRVVVVVEDGLIQDVCTMGVPVEYVVLEYDDGNYGDVEDLVQVPQRIGGPAPATLSTCWWGASGLNKEIHDFIIATLTARRLRGED